jgi:hypothetical protein
MVRSTEGLDERKAPAGDVLDPIDWRIMAEIVSPRIHQLFRRSRKASSEISRFGRPCSGDNQSALADLCFTQTKPLGGFVPSRTAVFDWTTDLMLPTDAQQPAGVCDPYLSMDAPGNVAHRRSCRCSWHRVLYGAVVSE